MITMIVIAPSICGSEWPREVLELFGRPTKDVGGRWSLGHMESWIGLSQADDVWEDYEPNVASYIKDLVTDPRLFLVEARNEQTIIKVLSATINRWNLYIDDDHGMIAKVSDFIVGRC